MLKHCFGPARLLNIFSWMYGRTSMVRVYHGLQSPNSLSPNIWVNMHFNPVAAAAWNGQWAWWPVHWAASNDQIPCLYKLWVTLSKIRVTCLMFSWTCPRHNHAKWTPRSRAAVTLVRMHDSLLRLEVVPTRIIRLGKCSGKLTRFWLLTRFLNCWHGHL